MALNAKSRQKVEPWRMDVVTRRQDDNDNGKSVNQKINRWIRHLTTTEL